jgi:TPR repeat protein
MSPFESVREELRLIHCVDILQTSTLLSDTIKALNYLRNKACHLDTEAKTKLSIIYSEQGYPLVVQDFSESSVWSRSVFDKQLSLALCACASIFGTTDDLSTTHFINVMTANMNRDGQEASLCYLAGLLYSKGIGYDQDIKRGISLLQFAATEGKNAEAACELGRIYGDRYKYSLNEPSESIHWFHRAFECGSTQAVVDLAYGFFEGSVQVPKDDMRALRYAKDGALLNDKYCQYIVGHLYLKGRGIQTNAQEAIKFLNASANQGFAVALEEETSVYMYGHGNVKQDYKKAYTCCMQTIAMNIPFCQARLGDMYRNAWGVTQDFHKSFEYYQNAASQSETPYPYAQHMLGEM